MHGILRVHAVNIRRETPCGIGRICPSVDGQIGRVKVDTHILTSNLGHKPNEGGRDHFTRFKEKTASPLCDLLTDISSRLHDLNMGFIRGVVGKISDVRDDVFYTDSLCKRSTAQNILHPLGAVGIGDEPERGVHGGIAPLSGPRPSAPNGSHRKVKIPTGGTNTCRALFGMEGHIPYRQLSVTKAKLRRLADTLIRVRALQMDQITDVHALLLFKDRKTENDLPEKTFVGRKASRKDHFKGCFTPALPRPSSRRWADRQRSQRPHTRHRCLL